MAKLRIKAPDGKTLVVDVGDADPSEYDGLASSAVADYISKAPATQPSMLDKAAGGVARLIMRGGPGGVIGDETKAGLAGITSGFNDLTAGGPTGHGDDIGGAANVAASEINRVEKGLPAATTAGKIGEVVGGQVTPIQIALQAGGAAIAEALGPWATDLMKDWSESAARFAVGVVNKVAKLMGVDDLSKIGQFLLKPVTIGDKTLGPIVTAFSSPATMKATAESIRVAAGGALDAVDGAMDKALAASPEALNVPSIIQSLVDLQEKMATYHPRAGQAVIKELEDHTNDLLDVLNSPAAKAGTFSALREFKTTLGDLIQNFESDAPVKAAAQRVYGVVAGALNTAAQAADKESAAAFQQANQIYTWILPILDALEGKVAKSSSILTDLPSMGMGILAGLANPAVAIPTMVGAHVGRKFGSQMLARGLNATAPLISKGLELSVQGIPMIARGAIDGYRAISDGLSSDGQ